jgi:hypothetical protein
MMKPATPKTKDTYNFATDKINYSVNYGGIHFVFLTMWPDSTERQWMEQDLKKVAATTPVILFVHAQPNIEAQRFINPNGKHDLNSQDNFENLLNDQLSDGTTINAPTTIEQRALEAFFRKHPNITAYFHGHDHWQHFSDWTGPDNTIDLHVFGVDSPMKGTVSANDETKLTFDLVTIDLKYRLMSVRECLWNANPAKPDCAIAWGNTVTVALFPRPIVKSAK